MVRKSLQVVGSQVVSQFTFTDDRGMPSSRSRHRFDATQCFVHVGCNFNRHRCLAKRSENVVAKTWLCAVWVGSVSALYRISKSRQGQSK